MRTLGILALTHSSRRTNLARCSVQFLTRRFGDPDRLLRLPPFEGLPPPEPLYSGATSFYRLSEDGGRLRCEPLASFKSRDKVQHVAFLTEAELLVGYERRMELRRFPGFSLERVYEHPHLAGLHTVAPLPGGRALLSCSEADAVLVLDLASGDVEKTLRMPASLYGHNYDLTPEMDLREHAIGDEQQTTHVNAAHPVDGEGRAVVSTLIQGAVGVFDLASGVYEEITRGFVGCHGARVSEEGKVYFADSPAGHLVFLDREGRIARRFDTGSRWLHDVQQLRGSLYAFALADTNELHVWDIDREKLLCRRPFFTWPLEAGFGLARLLPFWRGNSTQALSFFAMV